MKTGSVLGRIVTPSLRQDINCFGMNDCYPLSFGVTGAVMLLGIIILILGNSLYVKKSPSGNVLVKACKCIAVRSVDN